MADIKKEDGPSQGFSVIETPGEEHGNIAVEDIDPALAGRYKVTHGAFHLGLKDPKNPNLGHHIATRGATVHLTARDAYFGLLVETIEPVNEKHPGRRPTPQRIKEYQLSGYDVTAKG